MYFGSVILFGSFRAGNSGFCKNDNEGAPIPNIKYFIIERKKSYSASAFLEKSMTWVEFK